MISVASFTTLDLFLVQNLNTGDESPADVEGGEEGHGDQAGGVHDGGDKQWSPSSLRCGEVRCRDGTPTSREAADLLISPPPSRGHSIIIIIIILSSYHLVTPHLPAASTITPDP